MRKLIAFSVVLALMVLSSLSGCGGEEYEPAPAQVAPAAPKLEILESAMTRTGEDWSVVEGIAKNISGKELTHAELRVFFTDADRNRIEGFLAVASTSFLEMDGLWEFKVEFYPWGLGSPDIIRGYEIEEGVSY